MLATQSWSEVLVTPGADRMASIGFGAFLVLMGIAGLSALFVGALYRIFYRSRSTGSEIHRAFPLIGLSITAIFICIQFSLPLSLGLLGALSIVRFRTPIKEPEEIGFLMLVVATSLCCATFNLVFLGVILVVSVIVLLVINARRGVLGPGRSDGMVVLTLPAPDYRGSGADAVSLLEDLIPRGKLDAVTEGEDEVVLSYSFPALDRKRLPELQAAWRGLSAGARSDVYFTRDAGV